MSQQEKPTASYARDYAVCKIAAEILELPTLATRNSDELDFHELAIWNIRKAFEQAYESGMKAAGSPLNS